jgi:glycosyltransferase involved in cell wall biosynthesis
MSAVRQQIPPATLFLTWPKDHPVAAVPGVVALGYLDRMDLRRAYRSATLLVMPSLVETVGLPLIEAMSAGVPILAADRPYAHDVCGDAAIFFDPLDSGDLASKMVDLLSDAARREALAARAQALADSRGESSPYRRMVDLVAEVAGPEVVHMPR